MRRYLAVALIASAVAALTVAGPARASTTPLLSVSPAEGLRQAQDVEISAALAPDFSTISISVCGADADLTSPTTAAGSCELLHSFVSVGPRDFSWSAQRVIETPTGPVDCLFERCVVALFRLSGTLPWEVASVVLSFAAAPLVQGDRPTVGHEVPLTLIVEGTEPEESVRAVQCVHEGLFDGERPPGACLDLGPAVVTGEGHRASIAAIPRWIHATDGTLVDCAASDPGCHIGVLVVDGAVERLTFSGVRFTSAVAAAFDTPHGPLARILTETVHVGDRVDWSLSNIDRFGPGVSVQLCIGDTGIGALLFTCGSIGIPPVVGQASAAGSFSLPGQFTSAAGASYDCTALPPPLACMATVVGYREAGPSDPFVLLAVGAFVDLRGRSFVASPIADLADGDVVTIVASVGPHVEGGGALVAQCGFVTPSLAGLRCIAGSDRDPNFDGEYDGSIVVQRHFEAGGDSVDCSVMVCAVFLVVLDDRGMPIAVPGAAIRFAAETS